jgi:hypothetical protein
MSWYFDWTDHLWKEPQPYDKYDHAYDHPEHVYGLALEHKPTSQAKIKYHLSLW